MRPELRQELKLTLTPQLILNLRLLTLPIMELEMVVREELEKNPSLEETQEFEEPEEETKELEASKDEFNYAELLPEGTLSLPYEEKPEGEAIETYAPQVLTPIDTVFSLVKFLLAEEDYSYAEYILHNLDEDGLLLLTFSELKENLGIDEERLVKILEAIKSIPPGGIGAQTRREVFLAQLKLLGKSDSLEQRIIEDYYEAWLKMDYKAIAKGMQKEEREIREAFERMKILDPRPLRYYTVHYESYIEPDFEIRISGEKIEAIYKDDNLPQLRIAKYFREVIRNPKSFSPEEVEFAKEKVREALMFIKAIEERKSLLKRVVEYIIRKQERFFREGKEYLLPLTIKECGRELGLHPSNVSRAIQGKYLSMATGIFPLRYFFSTQIGEKSKRSVKERIKEMIEKEPPDAPLGDEEIVERLKAEGVNIARRTIAKYRQELKIPPAYLRKRR